MTLTTTISFEGVGLPIFAENIRLIIWDLDETFWSGTLTEGGVRYIDAHHDLIIDLAKRGIMSSICSKNDHKAVEAFLGEKGLWKYFIFPSIDWTPKALRVSAQIADIGLRPSTVLFIDDNPQNLNQVLSHTPDLNIADPSIIPFLLQHPQLQGKDDSSFSRLSDYKNLEIKNSAYKASGGDNIDFLRSSDVRVYIDYDVEQKIDRVIELINRTNQLNFTKERLPEDPDEAKAILLPFLRRTGVETALVRVTDKWGDHGYVGFYAKEGSLRHFCFSCRTINMYIEHFVYNLIGRPALNIVGEVVSDVFQVDNEIDWIKCFPISALGDANEEDVIKLDYVYARGGCDLQLLLGFGATSFLKVVGEHNTIKNWQSVRSDHSSFLLAALNGVSSEALAAAQAIGYSAEDFETLFPRDANGAPDVCLLSFWADANIPLYRHRATGLELPYWLIGTGKEDLTVDDEVIARFMAPDDRRHERIARLRSEWDFVGGLTQTQMEERFSDIVSKIPNETTIIMVVAHEKHGHYYSGYVDAIHHDHIVYNEAIRSVAKKFNNVFLIDASPYITEREHILDVFHYQRMVYYKMYCDLMEIVKHRKVQGD